MTSLFGDARFRRYLAGGSVSLLGSGLSIVPVYDIWDDATNFSWSLVVTLGENALFLVLTGVLVCGGVWLVRTDWETDRVTKVALRTWLATVAVGLVIGWAAVLQLQVMGLIKPRIIALDGILVGAITAFGLSVSSVSADAFQQEATEEQAKSEALELVYRAASDLEGATTHAEAYAITEGAVGGVLAEPSFRVVVDGEVVVDRTELADDPWEPVETIPVGRRGRIELLDGPFERHEVLGVDRFGTYLGEAIQRIEREERIREERDVLEFVNRTLRHDLIGDISLVQARLRMLERNADLDDDRHEEHLSIALGRVDEMDEFVTTMRTYMESILRDDHALEAVALRPVVEEHVETFREAHPDASIQCGEIPEVAITADDLIDRVLANLLSNAVEHNDARTPEVVIDAERREDVVRIRIADNGPGISKPRRESIFERGERGTESEGTGFGLYLVKDVVENYGGEIRVRDNQPRGTVFELDLPIASQ